ncbi:d4885eda-0fb1-4a99-9e56-0e3c8007606f [Sclerotinia trifoliorum]|uniref:D4885eda-0fb1-4a99-9e56-0e3c8007606f n=1 Tax=Sclerotinia trifoliorum TaxID=28548 RepID=A0A8H2ZLT5_9HELO|nr:d4885eda-0fb1-4a99-9e56-0e3c8007606f [Sclerotinia trifoliorum]
MDERHIKSVVEVTKHLLVWRNYNSASSLMAGLQQAKVPLDTFPQSHQLIDSKNNYGYYRMIQHHRPGIPWMFPLVKEFRLNQHKYQVTHAQAALMFPFKS